MFLMDIVNSLLTGRWKLKEVFHTMHVGDRITVIMETVKTETVNWVTVNWEKVIRETGKKGNGKMGNR